uniref:Uncharacterized protein n=1 Tax=Macrostomum lignano TaxID=282301 RepID=A0A1I8F552_9PLAT
MGSINQSRASGTEPRPMQSTATGASAAQWTSDAKRRRPQSTRFFQQVRQQLRHGGGGQEPCRKIFMLILGVILLITALRHLHHLCCAAVLGVPGRADWAPRPAAEASALHLRCAAFRQGIC